MLKDNVGMTYTVHTTTLGFLLIPQLLIRTVKCVTHRWYWLKWCHKNKQVNEEYNYKSGSSVTGSMSEKKAILDKKKEKYTRGFAFDKIWEHLTTF